MGYSEGFNDFIKYNKALIEEIPYESIKNIDILYNNAHFGQTYEDYLLDLIALLSKFGYPERGYILKVKPYSSNNYLYVESLSDYGPFNKLDDWIEYTNWTDKLEEAALYPTQVDLANDLNNFKIEGQFPTDILNYKICTVIRENGRRKIIDEVKYEDIKYNDEY